MKTILPNVIIANLHKRHTGVSSTIKALIPHQAKGMDLGIADWGDLKTGCQSFSVWSLIVKGYSRPNGIARYRILHARRAIDMVLGIFLRDLLHQRWKLVFTSATNHHHSKMFLRLLGKMDVIIATSSFTYNFLPKEQCAAEIGHGIDTTVYFPDPLLSEGTNQKDTEGNKIGCIGRVRYAKGVDLFVDTMLAVLPKFPEFSATIAGLCKPKDESYQTQLLARIDKADLSERIIFSGEVDADHMIDLYRSMVLCVASSRSEGFGLVPFEALASGIPVVTTDTGAWPILIGKDIGRVVPADNVDKLSQATSEILSDVDLRKNMRQNARMRAVKYFPINREANGINLVYTSLLT